MVDISDAAFGYPVAITEKSQSLDKPTKTAKDNQKIGIKTHFRTADAEIWTRQQRLSHWRTTLDLVKSRVSEGSGGTLSLSLQLFPTSI